MIVKAVKVLNYYWATFQLPKESLKFFWVRRSIPKAINSDGSFCLNHSMTDLQLNLQGDLFKSYPTFMIRYIVTVLRDNDCRILSYTVFVFE